MKCKRGSQSTGNAALSYFYSSFGCIFWNEACQKFWYSILQWLYNKQHIALDPSICVRKRRWFLQWALSMSDSTWSWKGISPVRMYVYRIGLTNQSYSGSLLVAFRLKSCGIVFWPGFEQAGKTWLVKSYPYQNKTRKLPFSSGHLNHLERVVWKFYCFENAIEAKNVNFYRNIFWYAEGCAVFGYPWWRWWRLSYKDLSWYTEKGHYTSGMLEIAFISKISPVATAEELE